MNCVPRDNDNLNKTTKTACEEHCESFYQTNGGRDLETAQDEARKNKLLEFQLADSDNKSDNASHLTIEGDEQVTTEYELHSWGWEGNN